MDIIEIENIFQQQFVKDINEKIKELLDGQIQIHPIDGDDLQYTIDKHSDELKVLQEKIEQHTAVLNEIQASLEKLNKSVAQLNKPMYVWRIR